MILDFHDRREGNFHDLAICDLDLYAGSGEGLGGFHAPDNATHAPAVGGDNLHIVLAIKRLESRECLGNFHRFIPPGGRIEPGSDIAFYGAGSLSATANATGKHYLAYRTCPCILCLDSNGR